jgi:7-keto-8-aminopelargonate synthetase-like enzyme
MDGDTATVREMCDLADKYGAGLIVDEAHSFGVARTQRCACLA